MNQALTPRQWGLMLLLSLAWGGSFFFMAVAVAALPPLTIVVCRVALATLMLWPLLVLRGQALPCTGRVLAACLGMALLNNLIPFSLIVWAQQSIPSGLASVVNAATPVFTLLVAHALTADEKLSGNRLAGVLAGLSGVAVLAGPAAFGLGPSGGRAELPGLLAGLGACLSYALAGIWGRRFARLGVPPLAAAAGQTSASTLLALPLMLLLDRPWSLPLPGAEVLLALLALGLVSTGLAYVLFFRLLQEVGASNTALVTQLVPVTAILLGALVLGESLLPRHFAGMALIGCGFLLIDGRALPWRARP
ncbi:DMT family transporter [Pseudoroseomonas cervicalis]|uniref:DMT family transporter n=1 Tax=Teichococcus cervicalis TaxID=204525 RepID=UPI0022F16C19|nr:DMT family transporter [Pseudoroseomonas cervicalis]WBV44127.1 DMT family transporter [Pseudoroseomonas cervicalis]